MTFTPSSRVYLIVLLVLVTGGAAGYLLWTKHQTMPLASTTSTTKIILPSPETPAIAATGTAFGSEILYQVPTTTLNPAIATDFDLTLVKDISAFEKTYGFTFSTSERAFLAKNKFVEKNLLETNIRPQSFGDNIREFPQLYQAVAGTRDILTRGPQNALFYSSDVFFNAYNNLYTELLKEMENKTFYPAITSLSKDLYEGAATHLKTATSAVEKQKWLKVRNYFAVPYAIFSTTAPTLTQQDYLNPDGSMIDPVKLQATHDAKDKTVDTYEQVAAFLKDLHLDSDSEAAVLADVKTIYDAKGKAQPQVFKTEYDAYREQEGIDFQVDFTQFTPRGSYASSSIRRQYFRGMKWYIMLPFFLKSNELTNYAFGTTQLLAEHPTALQDYNKLEAAINFMVGESDDLMPADYLAALKSAQGQPDQTTAIMTYLAKAHDPKIKDLAATYKTIGTEQIDDVRLKTKGLRFFSGKFIIDSYWTGFLTQGDEAVRPGYTQKLPPMASSLEVMTLLGSEYAKTQIPTLDFYSLNNNNAIDQALNELKAQNATLTDADWTKNLYTSWLWTIQSLFGWQKNHRAELPRFMQSPLWDVKTLETASAFWTELRHATILYAKQSFAELGGGPGSCTDKKLPPPAKSYIEPQLETYARLQYLAKRTDAGLKAQGYQLVNLQPLERYIDLMDIVQTYVQKELQNTILQEKYTAEHFTDADHPGVDCINWVADVPSEWEALRLDLVDKLNASIPSPVEGAVLPAKDRRVALVADVHTGGDSSYPTRILYEGTGVPSVIFTAVKDANGPRLTMGFTSSHYEFTKPYGGEQRITDEEWQKNFYNGTEPYDAFNYTDLSTWPKMNDWYKALFPGK